MPRLQDLIRRVEQLLLRYHELKRTNLLLEQQVNVLQQERHQLQLRLNIARSRIETLLARLPNSENSNSPNAQPTIEAPTSAKVPGEEQ